MNADLQLVQERISRLSSKLGIQSPTTPISDDPAPKYELRGGVRLAYLDKSPEVLASGAAGTGKTLGILAKLHRIANKYAGARVLFVRKTRVSLTESGLVTFERDVLGSGHPVLSPSNLRRVRQSYCYANGSEIVVAGMDKPDRVLSSDYDIAYFQEATEGTQEDWETIASRLRNGRVPYQQLIADCNPTTPTHWLYKRHLAKTLKLIPTTHKDNPRWWNATANEWTEQGRQYLARLDKLTGPRRKRFLEGVWAQAEGLVYDNWDANIHLINPFQIPPAWTRYWSIDFGFTNPTVIQFWAIDPDGRAYLYREIYKTKTLVEDHAVAALKSILAYEGGKPNWSYAIEPKPKAVICDHDAEGRATFERYTGLSTLPADKAVLAGIEEFSTRLRAAGDGKPRLFIFRDARCHAADSELAEAGLPTSTAEELDSYVWDKEAGAKERPIKENDHGADCGRYFAKHIAARKPSVGMLNAW